MNRIKHTIYFTSETETKNILLFQNMKLNRTNKDHRLKSLQKSTNNSDHITYYAAEQNPEKF